MPREPSRGGLAALVDVALGPRAHDTDVKDPRGATLVHLDVATPQVGAGPRVRHPRLHGGPHVFEESQFQRARQAVTDAVVPPHHPLPMALAVQAVARVCGEGRCLLLVIVLVGLGRAFNSALHIGAVVRASVAGAVAAPLGRWHDARHA